MPAYTTEQRTEAIALCLEHGMAETHQRTNIPKPTLHRWLTPEQRQEMAERFGEQTKAAALAHHQQAEATRAELQHKLLIRADRMLDRMVAAEVDYRGNVAKRVEFDEASPASCKAFATAAAILIDKYRLEMGEATGRTEHQAIPERTPEHEQELGKVIDLLAERRAS